MLPLFPLINPRATASSYTGAPAQMYPKSDSGCCGNSPQETASGKSEWGGPRKHFISAIHVGDAL
ncbi:hypothetical protein CALVIDRAFT_533714 [Calocera viscosa TUFC12733]|uniref:Uncharacterized protein n=1 Tax=Calocera viscosa (strain TUFC12733) TaxID=1330018 RepID=A0A167QLP5_CALVF|nr:hypothetical protein CALVIDRAFT_533714 [Calocera viscosa TUFC12733]